MSAAIALTLLSAATPPPPKADVGVQTESKKSAVKRSAETQTKSAKKKKAEKSEIQENHTQTMFDDFLNEILNDDRQTQTNWNTTSAMTNTTEFEFVVGVEKRSI